MYICMCILNLINILLRPKIMQNLLNVINNFFLGEEVNSKLLLYFQPSDRNKKYFKRKFRVRSIWMATQTLIV